MTTAGELKDRFRFDTRTVTDDQYGGSESTFAPVFTTAAKVQYLRGTEAVQSARLEGRQPVVVTIRNSAQGRAVNADYRAVDARTGTTYNITAPPAITPDRQWIEILAISGAGDG
jgi:head-tail adaptor